MVISDASSAIAVAYDLGFLRVFVHIYSERCIAHVVGRITGYVHSNREYIPVGRNSSTRNGLGGIQICC